MKRTLLLAAFAAAAVLPASAQSARRDNTIKLNLLALPARNLSFQYERAITRHFALDLGVSVMPSGRVPFAGIFDGYVSSDETGVAKDILDGTQMGGFAFTPEARIYLGSRRQRGFYLAPYARFGSYNLSLDYAYTDNEGQVFPTKLDGSIRTASAGLMVGTQWRLPGRLVLDWWIAGLSAQSVNLDLDTRADLSSLTAEERADLESTIEGTSIGGRKLQATVTDNGINGDAKFPLVGFRTGLALGLRF